MSRPNQCVNLLEFFIKFGIACFIFIPLGIWKLIEIIIWLFKHVKVG